MFYDSTIVDCVSLLLLVCRDVFLPADSLSLFLCLPPIWLSLHLHHSASLYVSFAAPLFTSPHHTELPLALSIALHQKCR